MKIFRPLYFLLLTIATTQSNAKTNSKNAVQEDIVDFKEFKKLLRTKTNVLILFVSSAKAAPTELKVFSEAAEIIRGTGTCVLIDCAQPAERKKLCKKLKVAPTPYILKHYKDGDFHKDYDRQVSVTSMVNFMRDPGGELPWQEDVAGADVLHFDYASFTRHLLKDMRPLLVMFYVPWCGYCKRLKPDYSAAATELKSQGYLLGAMDVERTENAPARRAFNITGFPTILYFERGQLKQTYEGENTKAGIIAFMQDPGAVQVIQKSAKDSDWSSDTNSEIVHLTTQGFEPALADENSVLVMFYAPWCGHCKRMKPEYERAAVLMRERGIRGVLAALDATKEPSIAEKHKVKGYPTVKYFVNGVFKYDVNVREAEKIVEFMQDPKEPPPPPAPEPTWEEEPDATDVLFLNEENFNVTLRRKKHALVMFYAPWCGHCKSTKPEFTAAANALRDDPRIVLAAVDCTRSAAVCSLYGIRGYPTFKYFSYLKTKVVDYNGGRGRKDFINYMSNTENIGEAKQREDL